MVDTLEVTQKGLLLHSTYQPAMFFFHCKTIQIQWSINNLIKKHIVLPFHYISETEELQEPCKMENHTLSQDTSPEQVFCF